MHDNLIVSHQPTIFIVPTMSLITKAPGYQWSCSCGEGMEARTYWPSVPMAAEDWARHLWVIR